MNIRTITTHLFLRRGGGQTLWTNWMRGGPWPDCPPPPGSATVCWSDIPASNLKAVSKFCVDSNLAFYQGIRIHGNSSIANMLTQWRVQGSYVVTSDFESCIAMEHLTMCVDCQYHHIGNCKRVLLILHSALFKYHGCMEQYDSFHRENIYIIVMIITSIYFLICFSSNRLSIGSKFVALWCVLVYFKSVAVMYINWLTIGWTAPVW